MPGSCQEIYFRNLSVIPREMYGVKLLLGSELNIMNPEGELDLSEAICKNLDLVIASIHSPCYGFGHSAKENTNAYVEVMKKPYVDMIGHPDDGRFPIDYEIGEDGKRDKNIVGDSKEFVTAGRISKKHKRKCTANVRIMQTI